MRASKASGPGGSAAGDRAALANTRFALVLSQWRQARALPVSSWNGVEVDEEGRIEKLDLHGKQVKCKFPQELCELAALKELILHTNRLSGTIPARLGELRALEKLDLWDNFLEGGIPKSLARLSNLIELHLGGNFLSGPIPPQLGKLGNLRALYLHGNKLSGEIPRTLGNLKRLQKLVLINNRLTGSIPKELSQLKVIVEINLANNRLSGSIPSELGQLSNLSKLYLWGNNLSGAIPESLGELPLLEKLDLAQNALLLSGGGIPLSLRNHRNFRRFVFTVPEHGAPVPPWRSARSLAPALLLGYLDFSTDLGVVLSYRSSGLHAFFGVGLALIALPALYSAAYLLRHENEGGGPWRAVAVMAQLGLLTEAWVSVREESYSAALVALRVIEPLFQSLPQLLLQAYVLLVGDGGFRGLRVASVAVSTLSLAYAATGIVAEHPLSQLRWMRGVKYPTAKFPLASSLFFGTVPYVGSVHVRMGFSIHPQDFVWWFLLYQVMEIVSRVLSLAVVALSLGYYVFALLAWLWFCRNIIARISIEGNKVRERLRFRTLIRFSASAIMDSVIDRVRAYEICCFFTCVETACFLAVGNVVMTPAAEDALVSDATRRIMSVVSVICLAGKIILAAAMIVPFKAKIGELVPPETGELRLQETSSSDGSSKGGAASSREDPGGLDDGDNNDPPASPHAVEQGISIDTIMGVVAPAAEPPGKGNPMAAAPGAVGSGSGGGGGAGGDGGYGRDDLESARSGAPGARSKTGAGGGSLPNLTSLRGQDLRTVEEGDGSQRGWAVSPGSKENEQQDTPAGGGYLSSSSQDEKTEEGLAPSHEGAKQVGKQSSGV